MIQSQVGGIFQTFKPKPTAGDDTLSAREHTPLPIPARDLLANDTAAEPSDRLTLTAIDVANSIGTARLNADGTVIYDPDGGFKSLAAGEMAIDSFRYTIDDSYGVTDTATITVTVTEVNDAPVADIDTASTNEERAIELAVPANDTDPDDRDTLAVRTVDSSETVGAVTLSPDISPW